MTIYLLLAALVVGFALLIVGIRMLFRWDREEREAYNEARRQENKRIRNDAIRTRLNRALPWQG